jgi:hypothetical protein
MTHVFSEHRCAVLCHLWGPWADSDPPTTASLFKRDVVEGPETTPEEEEEGAADAASVAMLSWTEGEEATLPDTFGDDKLPQLAGKAAGKEVGPAAAVAAPGKGAVGKPLKGGRKGDSALLAEYTRLASERIENEEENEEIEEVRGLEWIRGEWGGWRVGGACVCVCVCVFVFVPLWYARARAHAFVDVHAGCHRSTRRSTSSASKKTRTCC